VSHSPSTIGDGILSGFVPGMTNCNVISVHPSRIFRELPVDSRKMSVNSLRIAKLWRECTKGEIEIVIDCEISIFVIFLPFWNQSYEGGIDFILFEV
jgi:hypothetical protein